MIRFEEIDQTLIVTLDHSELGHSLGQAEAKVLTSLLKKHTHSSIIFQSTGSRFFCTGGNLAEQIQAKSKMASFKTQLAVRSALKTLEQHQGLTIALANGDCFGGGMELLSCFDIVLSAPHSFFGLWQRQLGLSFGWGGGRRLLNRTSLTNLKRQLLLSRTVSAYEAQSLGWVDEILPQNKLIPRAQEILLRHSQLPQKNFSALKLWSGEKEEKIFSSLWMKMEHQKALKKFKR